MNLPPVPAALVGLALLGAGSWAGEEGAVPTGAGPAAQVDYARDVLPLLSDRCFTCHGPDPGTRQAELRLDQRTSATADRGGYAVIVPGDIEASELIARITDHGDPMPPTDAKLELSADEVDLLTHWVAEGAAYAAHRNFTRPERHSPPEVGDPGWARDPLDRFVLHELEALELAPAPAADPATWLRRVSYDLRGLPPTVDELDAFLADDGPDARARVVDAYLASDAHAERMTADWLDAARYADTYGYQNDFDRYVWPWRDWVIDAFRANQPYDEFVTHQLAGDLVPDATRDTRLATTFNRLHRMTNEGGSVEEEFRVASVTDRVDTASAAFLGLTVACARCHDHKFDPISTRDYYAMSSYFDDLDEAGLYSHFTRAVPTPALDLPRPKQQQRLAALEAQLAPLEAAARGSFGRSGEPAGPQATFAFEPEDPDANGVEGGSPARRLDGPAGVTTPHGAGLVLSGDDGVEFPSTGVFRRSEPFSIGLRLKLPEAYERAVVLHRSRAWTDAGSRGYQVLVEDGRLTVALVHFWPGDMIAVRTRDPLPTDAWFHAAFTYDGSSRAEGLHVYLDGQPVEVEVVRDSLTRAITGTEILHLAIGSRFRDRGLRGGAIDDLAVYARELAPEELPGLAAADLALAPPLLPARERVAGAVDLAALQRLRRQRDDLRDRVVQIMTMRAPPPQAARTAFVLERGRYDARGEAVEPSTPAGLPALLDEPPRDRLGLARWITHPDHPLTARVQVDRLWRIAFGRGLVPTPEDLGRQAAPAFHADLLDTLARDLVDSGWDSRALLRRMVLSATYAQSSVASDAARERDPDNARLSRSTRRPLPAEMVRDGALRAAGLLEGKVGGYSVNPYQPPGLWQEKNGSIYQPGSGPDLRRRSVYTFWKRTSPPPAMTLFDAPAREACCVARPATTSPLQTLNLWNDPQYVEVGRALAERAMEAAADDAARVEYVMRALTARAPSEGEQEALRGLLEAQRAAYRDDLEGARALATFDLQRFVHPDPAILPPDPPADDVCVERAALAVVAQTVLTLDACLVRR